MALIQNLCVMCGHQLVMCVCVVLASGCETSAEKGTWVEDRRVWRNARRWRCSLDRYQSGVWCLFPFTV